MNNKEFYAHNAALIAVLVLGDNGHLGFTHTLEKRNRKYYSHKGKKDSAALQTRCEFFTCLLTMRNRQSQAWRLKFMTCVALDM